MTSAEVLKRCRICGNQKLEPVLDLGTQALTGVFPRSPDEVVTSGPLELVRCVGSPSVCGLVQLGHEYNVAELYGDRYGYRSGLNSAMVRHLSDKVRWLLARRPLSAGDVVLDVGSNDGTLLAQYPPEVEALGIDPTTDHFRSFHSPRIRAASEFFSRSAFEALSGGRKARIVTSIAMFYDLPDPVQFVRDVAAVLCDDGIWHVELSYLPAMLATCGYDTVCHEHAEYYGLEQLGWLAREAGLSITDIQFNEVNGGSIAVTMQKGAPPAMEVSDILQRERSLTCSSEWSRFRGRVQAHREELRAALRDMRTGGRRVEGLGASTKGNVLLQYCGIGRDLLPSIADVNPEKFGCLTPGTGIPIRPEAEALEAPPDVFLILPWHFRRGFVEKLRPHVERGVHLMFPLPRVEVVGR